MALKTPTWSHHCHVLTPVQVSRRCPRDASQEAGSVLEMPPAIKKKRKPDQGETIIQAHGHQLTVEWSQLGSDSGFQDVRQLLQEIVTSLKEEGPQFANLKEDEIMLQCPVSCKALDPDATLAGDEGKATRLVIQKSGGLEVWPAGAAKRSRNGDKLPVKPRDHGSDDVKAVPKSRACATHASFSLFPGSEAILVMDEDKVGTDKWEIQYDEWSLGRQPNWRPFSDKCVKTERNEMVYLTLSKLTPGATCSEKIRLISCTETREWQCRP